MSWTENLFHKAENWFTQQQLRRKGLLPTESVVRFNDMKTFLHHWTSLISGRTWVLQDAETWPATDGERLFFPPLLDIFTEVDLNQKAYLYIACFLTGNDEKKFPKLRRYRTLFQKAHRHLKDNENALAHKNLHASEDLSAVFEEWPWSIDSFQSLGHLWIARQLPVQLHSRQPAAPTNNSRGESQKTRTKKAREQIQVIESFHDKKNENPLVHSFEKLHTTDDYNGGQKKQDGEDELEDQAQSLEDLDLRQVIRSEEQTKAHLKGDYVMDLDIATSAEQDYAPKEKNFYYDEWDEGKKSYHKNWCRVRATTSDQTIDAVVKLQYEKIKTANKSKIDQLRRCFYNLLKSPRWLSRQLEGPELDLDALSELLATPAELQPDQLRIYQNRQKDLNELAIVLLFDRSLSSDSWVNNQRVLDVIRESLIVIGEALKDFDLAVQVTAFSSQTRHQIFYDVIKDFKDEWTSRLQQLLQTEPHGYTRIGPVLRHATAQLKTQSAKHKWIILLSDSKPTDFDKYEGRYGIRDVRKAIQEAKTHRVGVRCLSIDKFNRAELNEMYGNRGFELLSQIKDLPDRLGLLLRSLVQIAR